MARVLSSLSPEALASSPVSSQPLSPKRVTGDAAGTGVMGARVHYQRIPTPQPRDASDITKTLASAATLTSTGSGRSIARTPSSRQGSRRPASRARPNTSSKLSVATHAEELNLDEQELRAAMTKTPTAHKPLYVKHLYKGDSWNSSNRPSPRPDPVSTETYERHVRLVALSKRSSSSHGTRGSKLRQQASAGGGDAEVWTLDDLDTAFGGGGGGGGGGAGAGLRVDTSPTAAGDPRGITSAGFGPEATAEEEDGLYDSFRSHTDTAAAYAQRRRARRAQSTRASTGRARSRGSSMRPSFRSKTMRHLGSRGRIASAGKSWKGASGPVRPKSYAAGLFNIDEDTTRDHALSPAAGAADWFVGGPRGDTPKHVQAASDLELASTDLDAASSYQIARAPFRRVASLKKIAPNGVAAPTSVVPYSPIKRPPRGQWNASTKSAPRAEPLSNNAYVRAVGLAMMQQAPSSANRTVKAWRKAIVQRF